MPDSMLHAVILEIRFILVTSQQLDGPDHAGAPKLVRAGARRLGHAISTCRLEVQVFRRPAT